MTSQPPGLHPLSQAVVDHARHRGVDLDIRRFPAGTRTAQQAAAAIGVEVGAIVKSLLFMVGDEPWMVLMAGDRRLDEVRLAAKTHKTVRRASPEEVRSATGAAIGGVPPFGHPTALPTLVDASLQRFAVVWAAAGTPDSVVALTPSQIGELSQAQLWDTDG
ncbi:MAG: YbaK/EbsC family protein [Sulfobacillus sp.]